MTDTEWYLKWTSLRGAAKASFEDAAARAADLRVRLAAAKQRVDAAIGRINAAPVGTWGSEIRLLVEAADDHSAAIAALRELPECHRRSPARYRKVYVAFDVSEVRCRTHVTEGSDDGDPIVSCPEGVFLAVGLGDLGREVSTARIQCARERDRAIVAADGLLKAGI